MYATRAGTQNHRVPSIGIMITKEPEDYFTAKIASMHTFSSFVYQSKLNTHVFVSAADLNVCSEQKHYHEEILLHFSDSLCLLYTVNETDI